MGKSESIDNFSSEQEGGSFSGKMSVMPKLISFPSKHESVEDMMLEGGDLRKSLGAKRYTPSEDDEPNHEEPSLAFKGLSS